MVEEDVRRLLLDELDPSAGACTVTIARLVDAPADATASPEDLLTLVHHALESGDVPIGPIEYADAPIDYSLRSHVPVATITVGGADGPTTMKLALALGTGGCVGIGGALMGHLPHAVAPAAPGALLLPDLEAALAELVVYTRERARLLDYTGAVRCAMEVHSDWPLVPCTIDAETGGTVEGEPFTDFGVVRFDYTADMTATQLEPVIYEAARQVALRFGVDEPQFLTPPRTTSTTCT